jgi:hypothetical protein
MARITVRSISRSVHELLHRTPFIARILATFDHACDLSTPDGEVIALVTPHIGNGPLNIVVDVQPGEFQKLVIHEGHKEAKSFDSLCSFVAKDLLQIGELQIALNAATVWEPCPDWKALRAQRAIIGNNMDPLRAAASSHAPVDSLLDLTRTQTGADDTLSTTIRRAAEACRAGWEGDMARLGEGAAQLAGLGSGLTPSGDDFLVGMMLWAWLAHPAPTVFCRAVVEAAAPRTTTLSAAFLRSAAKGECSAAWHRLLVALATDSGGDLDAAVRQVLAHGATSGADALAGFLSMSNTP